jgi:N12 class adenine-specific DNA methylase
MQGTQLPLRFDAPVRPVALTDPSPRPSEEVRPEASLPPAATGEKAKARDILAAIRTLKRVEQEQRLATAEERQVLMRFGGFGPVALSIFPDPITGRYRDASWQQIGEELRSLLTDEEYASARRTTFNAFYTSSTVIRAMHEALSRLGVPANALTLEPGCGPGRFMLLAPKEMRFVGVELDSISGRIARLLHPGQDVRTENFRDSRLPAVDAVIGNVPFADIKLEHRGQRFSLHDYFFAKSVDALKPGGVLALVTSHYTLDKTNPALREYLAGQADFLGAIRLPSDAFKAEGTSVVTDIVFLKKRAPGQPAQHADPDWLATAPLAVEGAEFPVNRYFLNHPEMVLGSWSRKDSLYGEGFSVQANGELSQQLRQAVERLPRAEPVPASHPQEAAPAEPFTPPPAQPHLDEGSFFIAPDRRIHQVVGGVGQPVVYGGSQLWAGGALLGRRIGQLIELRDLARTVLRSQNEDWPEGEREKARAALNSAYGIFVSAFGPINKTTFSENAEGHVIRRTPNLVKFKEDPDAMLVMALEDYDEITGTASKAPIMTRDVVGKTPPVTRVRTAEEGLLASLNQRGTVDLPFIASLYGKPEETVTAELGELIYRDPQAKEWQTADAYLSGNVREKLAQAERAGPEYGRNALALRQVQPEDVLPGDIDANLGAPWIPEDDVRDFAAALFGVPAEGIAVAHTNKDALWSLDAGYAAEQSVAAKTEYGTARANGAWLLELALNLKTPVIYDPDPNDPEKRVVNQEETLAAREKQKAIKERFKQWVFTDPERTERLVRLYNDNFNNLRPRLFDGSHLSFPGMNPAITLRPHQADAVWRIISGGNTLLAHAVGAGKTNVCAAAAMKMRQCGLARKPLICVPNHMLEQFAREFQQLYPNARLLVAAKEDFTKEKRKLLTAKIASGDWDAILVTHSSFEKIGMSKQFQEAFLREQIAEYELLLKDGAAVKQDKARRNVIKTLEKAKANREQKLTELMAEDKKDDGLTFDQLGIDYLMVDEQHMSFKNLETPTKMERVAGIQTDGSERAFDLFMKCRHLHGKHPGHGITFATGTPISNTMGELYTQQRYLDPEGLKSRGIEHFDGWAGAFGEVVDAMEISPDGKTLKPRSRFAKFVNLPELQMMFRSFADVQTAEMLNLPRPALEGGKAQIVACPMSDAQAAIQQELVARYERLRNGRVDPRVDNALKITTDGRKLALDARLVSPEAHDFPKSKIHRMVANVGDIYRQTAATRGTQMIFCDLGVNPTPWGYSVYEDVAEALVRAGVRRQEIGVIGEADTDAKKRALFDKVRAGQVRVLIGSTAKMGTGTNVQKRLAALHHLDAPWKPAEVEQREGRILRQGNDNPEVAIYRYVTEGSFDAYMWQTLETKAKFINQVISGQNAARRAEDVGGQELSYAEVKAIASGNPAVLTLAETEAELQRLGILRKSHLDEQYMARRALRELPERTLRLSRRLQGLTADQATAEAHAEDALVIGGRRVAGEDAASALGSVLERLPERVQSAERVKLGSYRGLPFGIVLHPHQAPEVYLEGAITRHDTLSRGHHGPRAVLNAAERIARGYGFDVGRTRQDLEVAQAQLRDYQARLGASFAHEEYLKELTALRDALKSALSASQPAEGQPDAAEIAGRIKALRAAHSVEAAPERTLRQQAAGEEPVTARIRRRQEASQEAGAEAAGDEDVQTAHNRAVDRVPKSHYRVKRAVERVR